MSRKGIAISTLVTVTVIVIVIVIVVIIIIIRVFNINYLYLCSMESKDRKLKDYLLCCTSMLTFLSIILALLKDEKQK